MKKKKIILCIVTPVVSVVVLAGVIMAAFQNAKPRITTVDGLTLTTSSLQSEINTTGTVESTDTKNVSSTLTAPIKSISVEVGDHVNAGDVLCLIDSEDLEQQIAQQEATLENSNITSSYQLAKSEKNYNEAKNNLDNGMNTEVRSAQNTLKSAEVSLQDAQRNYDEALKKQNTLNGKDLAEAKTALQNAQINYRLKQEAYDSALNADVDLNIPTVKAAENELEALRTTYRNAKKTANTQGDDLTKVSDSANKVTEAKKAFDKQLEKVYEIVKPSRLYTLRQELEDCATTYDSAQEKYDKLATDVSGSLSSIKTALENAQLQYDNAQKAYNATTLSASRQLETYKAEMDNNRSTASNEPAVLQLAALKTKLDKCTVTAPISGTVTAVQAKEGSVPSGVLFVIENTDDLAIKANIKEYDIGKIAENMKVIISSDATGDDEYEGTISRVAPAGTKDASNSGTQFEIKVAVTSAQSKLLIGMSARLNIITEQKDGVFAVRYDALQTDEDGSNFVFIANDNGDGTYKAEKVPVTTGMETDFEVEISGDKIQDGTIVIADISNIQDGSVVRLSE